MNRLKTKIRSGRPRATDPRSEPVRFRLRRAEKAMLEQAAEIDNLRPAEYARRAILEAARKDIRRLAKSG